MKSAFQPQKETPNTRLQKAPSASGDRGSNDCRDYHRRWSFQNIQKEIHTMLSEYRRSGRRELSVKKIDFGPDGNARTNFGEFMRRLLPFLPPQSIRQPRGFPPVRVAFDEVLEFRNFKEVLRYCGYAASRCRRLFGRSLDFEKEGKELSIKFLRDGEKIEKLAREADVYTFLRSMKKEAGWDLKKNYPEVKIRIGRIAAPYEGGELAAGILENLTGKVGPIKLNEQYFFMAYESALTEGGKNPNRIYLNDLTLTHAAFRKAFDINIRDRFVMARHGLFDLETIELYHNSQGQRMYDPMKDLTSRPRDSRHGAGRVDDLIGATLFPNMRADGPSDLTELYFVDDVMTLIDFHDLTYWDGRIGKIVCQYDSKCLVRTCVSATLCGDLLFALGLMPLTYHLRRNELSYENETKEKNTFLQRCLQDLYEVAYKTYTNTDAAFPYEDYFDVRLIARQMAFFTTKACARFWARHKCFPQGLFHGAQLKGNDLGPRWKDGWGWGEEKFYNVPVYEEKPIEQRRREWGTYNSVNPVQEFIKSLFVTSAFMTGGELLFKNIPAHLLPSYYLTKGKLRDTFNKECGRSREDQQERIMRILCSKQYYLPIISDGLYPLAHNHNISRICIETLPFLPDKTTAINLLIQLAVKKESALCRAVLFNSLDKLFKTPAWQEYVIERYPVSRIHKILRENKPWEKEIRGLAYFLLRYHNDKKAAREVLCNCAQKEPIFSLRRVIFISLGAVLGQEEMKEYVAAEYPLSKIKEMFISKNEEEEAVGKRDFACFLLQFYRENVESLELLFTCSGKGVSQEIWKWSLKKLLRDEGMKCRLLQRYPLSSITEILEEGNKQPWHVRNWAYFLLQYYFDKKRVIDVLLDGGEGELPLIKKTIVQILDTMLNDKALREYVLDKYTLSELKEIFNGKQNENVKTKEIAYVLLGYHPCKKQALDILVHHSKEEKDEYINSLLLTAVERVLRDVDVETLLGVMYGNIDNGSGVSEVAFKLAMIKAGRWAGPSQEI